MFIYLTPVSSLSVCSVDLVFFIHHSFWLWFLPFQVFHLELLCSAWNSSLRIYLQFSSVAQSCPTLCGEGNGNPLHHPCLENPVDRGAWWTAVHEVTQSQTRLKWLSMHAYIGEGNGNPVQYSCLENPRDREAWWAAIYGVERSLAKTQMRARAASLADSQDYLWFPFLLYPPLQPANSHCLSLPKLLSGPQTHWVEWSPQPFACTVPSA